jgi:thioredoxin 1
MSHKLTLSSLAAVFTIGLFAFIPVVKIGIFEVNGMNKSGQGIVFIEEDWSKALAEAKKQKKLIFLDAYASWCGPCKLLKRKTFPDKDAGEFFNKNFINVALNMEKGDGPFLLEKFGVDAFPTLIIADGDGNMVTYTKGFISPKELIEFGQYGLKKKNK